MQDGLTALVHARTGHFVFESGHHGNVWLDLDELWTLPGKVTPFLSNLARRLPVGSIDVICGPMTGGAFAAFAIATELGLPFCYTERITHAPSDRTQVVEYSLPSAFGKTVDGRRVAVIDDVMNAGSATRGSIHALSNAGAGIPVIGALLVLGSAVPAFAASSGIELVAGATMPNELWLAEECPLCAGGIPMDLVAT